MPDWERLTRAGGRMLQELCDGGCGHFRTEVYALTWPSGHTSWECPGCWVSSYVRLGRPSQPRLAPEVQP